MLFQRVVENEWTHVPVFWRHTVPRRTPASEHLKAAPRAMKESFGRFWNPTQFSFSCPARMMVMEKQMHLWPWRVGAKKNVVLSSCIVYLMPFLRRWKVNVLFIYRKTWSEHRAPDALERPARGDRVNWVSDLFYPKVFTDFIWVLIFLFLFSHTRLVFMNQIYFDLLYFISADFFFMANLL